MAPTETEEAQPKNSRFSLKWTQKEKAPKVKKEEKVKIEKVHTIRTSPAMIFMFGLACGILSFFVGSMIMSHIFTG